MLHRRQTPLTRQIKVATGLRAAQPIRQRGRSPIAIPFGDRSFTVDPGQSLELSIGWMRRYLLIQNLGAAIITLSFDKPATATSMNIAPGGTFNPEFLVPSNTLYVFSTAGSFGVIVEG